MIKIKSIISAHECRMITDKNEVLTYTDGKFKYYDNRKSKYKKFMSGFMNYVINENNEIFCYGLFSNGIYHQFKDIPKEGIKKIIPNSADDFILTVTGKIYFIKHITGLRYWSMHISNIHARVVDIIGIRKDPTYGIILADDGTVYKLCKISGNPTVEHTNIMKIATSGEIYYALNYENEIVGHKEHGKIKDIASFPPWIAMVDIDDHLIIVDDTKKFFHKFIDKKVKKLNHVDSSVIALMEDGSLMLRVNVGDMLFVRQCEDIEFKDIISSNYEYSTLVDFYGLIYINETDNEGNFTNTLIEGCYYVKDPEPYFINKFSWNKIGMSADTLLKFV